MTYKSHICYKNKRNSFVIFYYVKSVTKKAISSTRRVTLALSLRVTADTS